MNVFVKLSLQDFLVYSVRYLEIINYNYLSVYWFYLFPFFLLNL